MARALKPSDPGPSSSVVAIGSFSFRLRHSIRMTFGWIVFLI